jgi:dCMP deaminase
MGLKNKHLQMYLRMSKAVAETSSAKRLKVGAVAVKNNMVIASGYNGLPSNMDGECEFSVFADDEHWWLFDGSQNVEDGTLEKLYEKQYPEINASNRYYRLATKPEVRHAEHNLLLNLAKSAESSVGCTIFLTHSPCPSCCADLIDAGVAEVYYEEKFRDTSGILDLIKAGITVEQIK